MGETNELFLLGCAASVSLETGTIIIFQFRLASPRKHALLRHQFSHGPKAPQDSSKICNGLTWKIENQKSLNFLFRHFHLPVFPPLNPSSSCDPAGYLSVGRRHLVWLAPFFDQPPTYSLYPPTNQHKHFLQCLWSVFFETTLQNTACIIQPSNTLSNKCFPPSWLLGPLGEDTLYDLLNFDANNTS